MPGEVYKIMQVSNSASGYKAGDRVYVGYINSRGEFREAKVKTNLRNGRKINTKGYTRTVKSAGNKTLQQGKNIVAQAQSLSNSKRR